MLLNGSIRQLCCLASPFAFPILLPISYIIYVIHIILSRRKFSIADIDKEETHCM